MNKIELINYLNDYLNINDFKDASKNGLQIDSDKTEIKKIGYAVDATTYTSQLAVEKEVDMLIVHHGVFWGFESTITNEVFTRTNNFIKNNICLYGCHLPLDAHNEVGNNIGLIKAIQNIFGWNDAQIEKFGDYAGEQIGWKIISEQQIHIGSIISPFAEQMGLEKKLYNFGNKEYINSIGIISGGGGNEIRQAKEENLDLYITGEAMHYQITNAKEIGQSILLGGHRETEKIGVKLLANHIKNKLNIETIFLDEKY